MAAAVTAGAGGARSRRVGLRRFHGNASYSSSVLVSVAGLAIGSSADDERSMQTGRGGGQPLWIPLRNAAIRVQPGFVWVACAA